MTKTVRDEWERDETRKKGCCLLVISNIMLCLFTDFLCLNSNCPFTA